MRYAPALAIALSASVLASAPSLALASGSADTTNDVLTAPAEEPATPDPAAEPGADPEEPDPDASGPTEPAEELIPDARPPAHDPAQDEPAQLTGTTRLDADGLFDSEERAYGLYMEGLHALEDEEDADLAIAKWEEAVRVLPDERPYARSRGALALRLVTAHDLRFGQCGELSDLRRQRSLLLGYQARLGEMYPADVAARQLRHDRAQVRIDEIDDELQRIEGDHGTVEDQLDRSLRGEYEERAGDRWRPDPTDMGWHARPDDPRLHARQAADGEDAPEELVTEGDDEPTKKAGTGLLVTGGVLTGLGLGGIGVGVAGMLIARRADVFDPKQAPDARREQMTRGENANVMAVTGLAAGGALAVTGVVLLAVGAKRRRTSTPRTAFAPAVSPGFTGITAVTRF